MKPVISMGLMLLLASCAAPENQSATHHKTAYNRPNDTLRPKPVTVAHVPAGRVREWQPGDSLPGFRTYGLVEAPAPIASFDAPAARSRPVNVPRRVVNNVTQEPLEGTEAAPVATTDVTTTGSHRVVINQITNRPLRSGEGAYSAASTTKNGIINEVTNQPLRQAEATPPALSGELRTGAQRTVIDPITNKPVQ